MDLETRNKLHIVLIELLDEFVRICKENNLIYFLSYGTLLGAVRHKGFIPWDDDIDVSMPRNDFEKFLEFFENSDITNYYVLSYRSNSKAGKYFIHYAKLLKSNTVFAEAGRPSDSYTGIFIDIFPFDNCINILWPLQAILLKYTLNLYFIKTNIKKRRKKVKILLGKIACCFFSEKFISDLHRKLYLVFNRYKTKYIASFSGIFTKKEIHKKDEIFPLTKVLFEGKYYFAPKNCDKYLSNLYKNYMELPPVEKRHTHNPLFIVFNNESNF